MNLLVLGPQGRARERRRSGSRPSTGSRTSRRATCSAPRSPRRPTLGRQVEPILAAGELVPDELTVATDPRAARARPTPRDGFVLDGFPRNEAQADALDEMLREIGRGLDAILFFDLPDDVATERMLGRAADEGRTDDTPEVIARRLEIYHAETEPIVEHYRVTGKLVPLHADALGRRGLGRDPAGARAVRGRAHDHPQERAGDRADGARRRGRRRARSR